MRGRHSVFDHLITKNVTLVYLIIAWIKKNWEIYGGTFLLLNNVVHNFSE